MGFSLGLKIFDKKLSHLLAFAFAFAIINPQQQNRSGKLKKQAKQEVQALLQGALHAIVAAAHTANDGQPAGKDVAELMAAWGTISKVVSHPRAEKNRAFTTAQLAMLDALMGAAA